MTNVAELINETNVRCHTSAASRKRVLQMIAELVVEPGSSADTLFDGLMARERLGSTGLGEGVAIPHCRTNSTQIRAAFITLDQPIDYEAVDGEYVDILFVLVVPEEEQHAHLQALSQLAEVFSSAEHRVNLRACQSDQALLSTLQNALNQQATNVQSA